jgi:hypothetical protein
MADLIILRLHPIEPVDGASFTAFLNGITIRAFDLSFGDSVTGVLIGEASGLANPHLSSTSNNTVNINNRAILQNYRDVPDPPPPPNQIRVLESVATAVLVVNAPAGHPEYPSSTSLDIRLEITRGGKNLVNQPTHYNVTVTSIGSLSTNQKTYFAMEPSAYVALPSSTVGLDPALAYVDLPSGGQPPKFGDLVSAINLVLAQDPGGAGSSLQDRPSLSAAQSHQIAAEIVWNRTLYPPPQPNRSLGELYTWPPADPAAPADKEAKDAIDRDRKQFEAEAAAYQATHDGEALRLAGFVYAASASVACERLSKAAARAGLRFPVITGGPTTTEIAEANLIFSQAGPLNPSFVVPAAFFYALGAMIPPQVKAEQRYDMARLEREERLLGRLQAAIDESVIPSTAAPLTVAGAPAINGNQAARYLHALGSTLGSAPKVSLAAPVTTIVTDWLAYAGPTVGIDTGFWTPEVAAEQDAYLELLLLVITQDHAPLIAAIKAPPLSIANVAALVALTDQQWRTLFLGPPVQIGLLPEFTQPGTPANRTEAFIRHLRSFFVVPGTAAVPLSQSVSGPPTLGVANSDIFQRFVDAYLVRAGAAFTFGTPASSAAMRQAIGDVFPGDLEAQDWLVQALETIDALFQMTDLGPAFSELHFSLIEALFARGFTGPQDVTGLSPQEFQDALTGTVAYSHAATIYAKAGVLAPSPVPTSFGFRPINPDGRLTDCIPPPHLSPLGPVAYLVEMLRVSAASSCENPFPKSTTLSTLLASRRGPLSDLHATRGNLETPLPMIDLVNESLEALADGLPAIGGAIYDTAAEELAGHRLAEMGHSSAATGNPDQHNPQTLFAALPEHSSPATPVKEPGAYDALKVDFSAPSLPYAQALDINRSYLRALGSDRFTTMRTFREEITEFVLDPTNEPPAFQKNLWRYPVRFPIALESLGITEEEYSLLYAHDIETAPAAGRLVLHEVYGFPHDVIDGKPWTDVVVVVPQFLARTGLTYCEFLELWRTKFVPFVRAGSDPEFPQCLPCCPDDLVISIPSPLDTLVSLRKLAVFIRLWRTLQQRRGPKLSFNQLRDICDVIPLFDADAIQPEFVRQLAGLLLLRDFLDLPLFDPSDPAPPGATGAARTHLLALWVGAGAAKWNWAIATLLEHVDAYAEAREQELQRPPELVKILPENLDALSRIMGFDPATPSDSWHAQPTSTLRFAELLVKVYRSGFTVGELLFLFTNADHLPGDDPFPLGDANEALEDPLNLPEDEDLHQLWALRQTLLEIAVSDAEVREWSWPRIVNTLQEEFGWGVAPGAPDPLQRLGEHCFPTILEAAGQSVSMAARQYRVALLAANTAPLMWNTPPGQPFQYDISAQELWTQIPLRDEGVVQALQQMRSLTLEEQAAIQDLYFLPRSDISLLSFLFVSVSEAIEELIQQPDEAQRWSYFQREFAYFYRRCRAVAQHLTGHVAATTGREVIEQDAIAWKLLRHLHADENIATTTWEDDAGIPPILSWSPRPHGGAFAALLGVCGTGLLTEFQVEGMVIWREVGTALSAFGQVRNTWNTPVPVILPALNHALTPEQQRFVVVRNGMALRDLNGEPLGGAQPFRVHWSGVLMIEISGNYQFFAGAPTPPGEEPGFDEIHEHRWRLTLKRGQKQWILLNHLWSDEDAPDHSSGVIGLRRGAYEISVVFEQEEPTFAAAEEICRRNSGFEIKYIGPDSDDCLVVIPIDKLFRDRKIESLDVGFDLGVAPSGYLKNHYTSSLRDLRRTYQRAFKALFIAHRFALSARVLPGDRQSELGYIIDHAAAFHGTSYPRTGQATFDVHHAYFDVDFLPVRDAYKPPNPGEDLRGQPSPKRQAALFDWWERLWDYVLMRAETRGARERPAWLLFYEASERQPDDPPQLVRHLGVDIRHAPLVLNYFATPVHVVQTPELEDERWAIRAWQAEKWIRRLQRHFFPEWIGTARPDLWASDDPNAAIGGPPVVGNENLTRFVRMGSFENGDPRRYEDVMRLNNALRLHARDAFVAFLAGMERVPLPWGGYANTARDLTDLLLQDVEVGVCERASRIEEAITAIQSFVQRARLGLEPGFSVSSAFSLFWDRQFGEFWVWAACRRRWVYRENWIAWDETEKARKTEAFRFLESELRRATLTIPVPGGLEYWSGPRPPIHPGLTLLQHREPAGIQILTPGPDPEGLDLLGTPERHARPSWLAPLFRIRPSQTEDGDGEPNQPDNNNPDRIGSDPQEIEVPNADVSSLAVSAAPLAKSIESLPLWIQAAIRLGTRFVRVAAAGVPPAATGFYPRTRDAVDTCCKECGKIHPPVVDEYYFWLLDSRHFSSDDVVQNAEQGLVDPTDPDIAKEQSSDWHRPEKLPGLLLWGSQPMVHLYWCRFHNGEFMQTRRSDEGVEINPATLAAGARPQLVFKGRTGDSLRFEVVGGMAPIGYGDPAIPNFDQTPPGFRYDLATDEAVVAPQVVAPAAIPANPFPGSLPVYPYFAHFAPGAPLLPASMFAETTVVATALRSHCRFEAALKWYSLLRDPLQNDSSWAQCPPDRDDVSDPSDLEQPSLRDIANQPNGNELVDSDSSLEETSDTAEQPNHEQPIEEEERLPCCPSTPVTDEVARNRAVTLEYLETLQQWGDSLMCRNTPESFQQARVIFDTLRRILGAHPLAVMARDDASPMTLGMFQPRPAPLNPRLRSLFERSDDRLALIHHCLNGRRRRNGIPNVDMPYFGNSPLRDGWQATGNVCEDDADWCLSCCHAYRFVFLIQKALELAGEVRNFGAGLLAAYEKGDAEYLMSLRSTHERQLLALALEVRQLQWRESDWQVQALEKTKESAQTRLRYFKTLLTNGLNAGEIGDQSLTAVALATRISANIVEGVAQGMGAVPDMWIGVAGIMGSPLQFNQLPLGTKLAGTLATAARILNSVAENASTSARLSLTEGGWDRREEEWRHQVEVIGIEIEQIERQILAAERQRNAALCDLNNHQRQIENAMEVQNFLRDKFTSHELYLYLQQQLAALHRQSYELALYSARQAQQAFNYERGHTAQRFLIADSWDNLHEGLLAGEKLQVALHQMEKAYLNANCREYELTKHISLREHFPHSFLQLRATGYCELELPEWLFDLDYPGHYMRRIKNVSVTVPCVAGAYSGVHCRLTLLSSQTRVDPRLIPPPERCCDDSSDHNSYHARAEDFRIVKTYAATEAIATSSGQNDSGLFELSFRDERYLPFEFAGTVSRWRIELPPENNQWPIDSLGDFVVHLNYTSREGGDVLRRVANAEAQHHRHGHGVRLIDVKHELSDLWQLMRRHSSDMQDHPRLPLSLNRTMFPFLPSRRKISIHRIELLFETPGATLSATQVVEYTYAEQAFMQAQECDCDRKYITCVASSEWPGRYHGVLNLSSQQQILDDPRSTIGSLLFQEPTTSVESLFLIVWYRADQPGAGFSE